MCMYVCVPVLVWAWAWVFTCMLFETKLLEERILVEESERGVASRTLFWSYFALP